MADQDYKNEALTRYPDAFERYDGVYVPVKDRDAIKVGSDWYEAATGKKTVKPPKPLNNFEIGLLHELHQNLSTIHFLYDCLENPTMCKHAYPDQTRDRMNKIIGILNRTIGVPKGCTHSFHRVGCDSCEESMKFRMEHVYDERLGW